MGVLLRGHVGRGRHTGSTGPDDPSRIAPPIEVHESAPKWGAQGALRSTTEAGSSDWRTPQDFFDSLHATYAFEIDCAGPERGAGIHAGRAAVRVSESCPTNS